MDIQNNKTKDIRFAAITAVAGNAVLATLNIVAGMVSGSSALVANGVDSLSDVSIGIMTLALVRVISKPADVNHPWGHKRAETVATAFLAFLLFFMGAQLIFSSVSSLISGEQQEVPSGLAIVVAGVSIAGKLLLAYSQYILGKRANSSIIKANAKNMTSDVLMSVGVLVGLVISTITGLAHVDLILAVLIGAWIIKTAIGIFLEVNLELMDGNNDMEPYRIIVEAVNKVEGASNVHRARIRRIAGFWDIVFDVDVDPNNTVLEAHNIAVQVEDEIKRNLENVLDIIVHIEPCGSDDTNEGFGLSERAIEEAIQEENVREENSQEESIL